LRLEAGCGCTQPGWPHLLAQTPLAPVVMEKKNAACARQARTKWPRASRARRPRRRAGRGGGVPGALRQPLAAGPGLAAWQHKVTEVAALLEALAARPPLQLQVSTDRQNWPAPSPRAATRGGGEDLALQARIKSAEAELERVRQASQDVERALSALAASPATPRAPRMPAQCQARPPQQQQASAESGRASSGGGISTAC
jgi:hypothetical protein